MVLSAIATRLFHHVTVEILPERAQGECSGAYRPDGSDYEGAIIASCAIHVCRCKASCGEKCRLYGRKQSHITLFHTKTTKFVVHHPPILCIKNAPSRVLFTIVLRLSAWLRSFRMNSARTFQQESFYMSCFLVSCFPPCGADCKT